MSFAAFKTDLLVIKFAFPISSPLPHCECSQGSDVNKELKKKTEAIKKYFIMALLKWSE